MTTTQTPKACRAAPLCCVLISWAIALWPPACAGAQDPRLEAAEALYEAGHYTQSALIFQKLLTQTQDRDTQAFCLLRLGDCWWVGDWWPPQDTTDNQEFFPDQYYALAMEIGYSPYLAESYFKWCAVYQAWNHGVSNSSAVPYALYEAKRRAVLDLIAKHLAIHSNDEVALAQKAQLEEVPAIESGGPAGSAVLNHIGALWPNILRKETGRSRVRSTNR